MIRLRGSRAISKAQPFERFERFRTDSGLRSRTSRSSQNKGSEGALPVLQLQNRENDATLMEETPVILCTDCQRTTEGFERPFQLVEKLC